MFSSMTYSVYYDRILGQLEDTNVILSGDTVRMPTENLRREYVD